MLANWTFCDYLKVCVQQTFWTLVVILTSNLTTWLRYYSRDRFVVVVDYTSRDSLTKIYSFTKMSLPSITGFVGQPTIFRRSGSHLWARIMLWFLLDFVSTKFENVFPAQLTQYYSRESEFRTKISTQLLLKRNAQCLKEILQQIKMPGTQN